MRQEFQHYDPKTLQTVFNLLLIVQIVFGIIVWYLIYDTAKFYFDYAQLLHIATPSTALALNFFGNMVYKSGFEKIDDEETLIDRLIRLQRTQITRFTLTEAATFVLFVMAVILDNNLFLVLGIINIFYFLTLRPKIISFNSDSI
jgi:hypothetical protein